MVTPLAPTQIARVTVARRLPKRQVAGEFGRYFLASAVALATDVALLGALTEFAGIPYLVSGAVGFLCGAAVLYVLAITWVFQVRGVGDKPALEFVMFAGIGAVGLGINEVSLYCLTDYLRIPYIFSKSLTIALCFTWNFTARRMLLFR